MNADSSNQDQTALFCRTAASLATARTRENRALLYLKSAFELVGAKRVGVVWRRRDSLICLESEAFSDPVRRVFPSESETYDTYVRTTATWQEGTRSLESREPGWYPPRFRRKGECYLFLPEGRSGRLRALRRPDRLRDRRAGRRQHGCGPAGPRLPVVPS